MPEQQPTPPDRPWWGEPWPGGENPPAPTGAPPTAPPGATAPAAPPPWQPPTTTAVLPAPAQKPPASHHPRLGYALLVVVVALLAAGGGAAVGVHFSKDSTNGGGQVTTQVTNANAAAPSGSIEAVAAAVAPSVVSIVEQISDGEGEGSGVVLDAANGYILTNNHVVSGYASDPSGSTLTVTTSDGRSAKATVVGRDPSADIAVIRVSLDKLTQARTGDSSSVRVGQTVVAFGSPLGLQGSVTSGIISALGRPVATQDATGSGSGTQATIDALQTDAAINPGNSGGPLVDLTGHVIGINSAIASLSGSSQSGTESGSIGLGFSIPINEALYTANQLIKSGHAVHAVIGVTLQPTSSRTATDGAVVGQVTADGPAAKAGIKPGDVIVAVDDRPIPDADTAIVAIRAGHKPGDTVKVTIVRNGGRQTLSVTLGASDPS